MYLPLAKEVTLIDISFLALVACFSAELNILINFGRWHHEEHFFDIILKLDQWFKTRGRFKIVLIYSSVAFLFCPSKTFGPLWYM